MVTCRHLLLTHKKNMIHTSIKLIIFLIIYFLYHRLFKMSQFPSDGIPPPPIPILSRTVTGDHMMDTFACQNCKRMISCGPDEKWKTVCLDCYKKLARKCISCTKNMPLKAESWKKQCVTCYKNTKQIQCPSCPNTYTLINQTIKGDRRCESCLRRPEEDDVVVVP